MFYQDEQGDYSDLDGAVDTLTIACAAPITELVGFIRCLLHGDFWGTRCVKFRVPLCADWSAGVLLGVLARHGIDVYEYGAAGGYQFVIVDRDDEIGARKVFYAYGVPYEEG